MTSCGHQGTTGQQLGFSWQQAGSRQGVSGLHMQRVQVIFTRISADCQAWHVLGSIRRVLGEARALGIATPLHCAQVSRARLRARVLVPPPWPASRAADSSSRPAPPAARSSAATSPASCHSSLLPPPPADPHPLVATGFTDLLCSSCRRRRRHLPAPAASRPFWAPPPPPPPPQPGSAAHALWSPSPGRRQLQRARPRLLRACL